MYKHFHFDVLTVFFRFSILFLTYVVNFQWMFMTLIFLSLITLAHFSLKKAHVHVFSFDKNCVRVLQKRRVS